MAQNAKCLHIITIFGLLLWRRISLGLDKHWKLRACLATKHIVIILFIMSEISVFFLVTSSVNCMHHHMLQQARPLQQKEDLWKFWGGGGQKGHNLYKTKVWGAKGKGWSNYKTLSAYMPTLPDTALISCSLHRSQNVPDKINFWAFQCFCLKLNQFSLSKHEIVLSIVQFLGHGGWVDLWRGNSVTIWRG